MAKQNYFCLIILLFSITYRVSSDVLCESGFCRNYVHETGCGTVAQECSINNATHSGLWLPSPTICNCCQFCLPFIVEGDLCSLGGPGMGTTVGRCGHGLTCRQHTDGHNRCQRMVTDCHIAQDEYDWRHSAGQTGSLEERPACDGKGKYASYSCVPTQSCFCQSEEGERIFGEALYTGASTVQNMHCACSRFHETIKKNIQPGVPYPVAGPRCTSDGNFHPIQCVGRTCYCVNTATGLRIEGKHRSVDLDVHPLTRLECYDSMLDFYPEQSEGSPPFNITTPCFDNTDNIIEMLDQSKEDGFNVDFFSNVPSCLPDGTFGRVSTTRNRTKICVDERGRRIGDYETFPGTTDYDDMDCKCAYTAHVVMASSPERPLCCSNGSFRRVQCRRGRCRCVDADGRQEGADSADPALLTCYTQNWRTC